MSDLNISEDVDFYKYYPEASEAGDVLSVTIGRYGVVIFEIEGDVNNRIKYRFKNEGALLGLFERLTKIATHFENQGSTKSCFNCGFYDGEKCTNEQLGLVPLDQRDPPYTTVIKEKGCELFQSSESTERNES